MRAALLSISLAALAFPVFAADTKPARPNVLFIVIDDLKPLLGIYGASWITDQVESIELYDYQTDPIERENLAGKTERAAVLKKEQALFDKLLPHLPKPAR